MRLSILCISMGVLAACSPKPTDAPTALEPDAVPAVSVARAASSQAASETLPELPENYWQARKILVAAGYTPVRTNAERFRVCTERMERTMGARTTCPSEEIVLPEVEACAGTGLGNCRVLWRSPGGRNLTIFTIDGPQPGIIQEMQWEPASAPAAQAPARDAPPRLAGSYWVARKALIERGYTPVNHRTAGLVVCVAEMEQGRDIPGRCPTRVADMPEIDTCEGPNPGRCKAVWRSPENRNLTVMTSTIQVTDSPVAGETLHPGAIASVEWSTGEDAGGTGLD